MPFGRVLRYGLALLSLAAAAIHASAIAGHTFHWLHLTVFVAMTIFQAWWAYLILRAPTTRVLVIGAVGHGSIFALWLVSRTIGIPSFLPGSHSVEPVGLKDGAATLLALLILAGIDTLSRRDMSARLVRPSAAGAGLGALFAAVVILAAAAVLADGHVHDHSHDHVHSQRGYLDHQVSGDH